MSDFDKEAERERLREKYERDEEKREVTERMSELLLKGATMTNAHCQDCGDPIFRYDGQEFCPTCQKAVSREGDAAGDADGDEEAPASASGDADDIQVATPDETRVQFGGDDHRPADAEADEPEAESAARSADAPQQSAREQPERPQQANRPPQESPARAQSGDVAAAFEPDSSGDLTAARASLSRSVTRLARQAEAAEDRGRKRDLLAATREAAEALSAVRDAGR